MKRILLPLCVLVSFVFLACSTNESKSVSTSGHDTSAHAEQNGGQSQIIATPLERMEKLVAKVENHGNEWTSVGEWKDEMRSYVQIVIDFADSNPSADEIKAYQKLIRDIELAFSRVEGDAATAMNRAEKILAKDEKELYENAAIANKKLRELEKDLKGDADSDDDYNYDDYNYDSSHADFSFGDDEYGGYNDDYDSGYDYSD